MPRRIDGTLATGGRIVDDDVSTVGTIEALDGLASDASIAFPLALWQSERDRLVAWRGPKAVQVDGHDDPASITSDLALFATIAIDFPKFTDGRGYSLARLLREQYGYTGTLRATGDVLRDQLFYLLRCGFDSFAMRHPERIDDALAAFGDFSDAYQTSVERPLPWFRRRQDATSMPEAA